MLPGKFWDQLGEQPAVYTWEPGSRSHGRGSFFQCLLLFIFLLLILHLFVGRGLQCALACMWRSEYSLEESFHQGLSSSNTDWRQAPLPAEPYRKPSVSYFYFSLRCTPVPHFKSLPLQDSASSLNTYSYQSEEQVIG